MRAGATPGTLHAVRRVAPSLALALALGCTARPEAPRSAGPEVGGVEVRIEALRLPDDDALTGSSGVARRSLGVVWMAPERTGALVELNLRGNTLTPKRRWPIEGLPEGTDVEALAFVPGSPRSVLLGTEARGSRSQDPILVADIDARGVEVRGALVFDYAPFGVVARNNQGIEGLCAVDGFAIAASEAVLEEGDRRFACVGRFTLPEGAMKPYRVGLASARGKISALTCRRDEARVVVHAIERHFGTMRLVRFTLGEESEVSAELVSDLAPALGPEPPNIEGLTWIDAERLLLVSDNHYRVKTGPTRAFIVDLGAASQGAQPAP